MQYLNRIEVYLQKRYIERKFIKRFGRLPDLKDPKTFNEKLQWLKLYWRNDLAEQCADKYGVRQYVEAKGLGNTLNDLVGVYDSVDEIDLSMLPDRFALKATHGSGWNIICQDKQQVDWERAFKQMRHWLKRNYYYTNLEWVYKRIKKRIICEQYLEGKDGEVPIDYKILCFNGEPKCLFLCLDRFSGTGLKVDFYDLEWNKMPFRRYYPNSDRLIKRPEKLDDMLEIARRLSKGFPFVRVDLFQIAQRIVFGEMTFFPGSGFEPFEPEEYDELLGSWLELHRR